MEQARRYKLSRAEWVFIAIVLAVLGYIVAGKQMPSKQHAVRYKHSLAYPKVQAKALIQVGSLDRG